jgi:hypothetical protein
VVHHLALADVHRRQLTGVQRADAVVDVVLGDVDLGGDLGEDEARVLERPDGLPERLPLGDVGQRQVQRRPRGRDRGDRDREPLLREVGDELPEALPFVAPEQVLHRHADVAEEQLGGVLRVLAELVQVPAACEARHAALQHEQRHAAVPLRGVGLHGRDDEVRVDPVGDERLRTVDDVGVAPVVLAADRGGGHRREVRADPRLGHADGGDQLAGDDPRQPALLLLLGAVGEEVGQADVVVQAQPQAGAGVRGAQQLLAEHGVEPEVAHAAAPVALGDLHAQEALAPGGGEQLAGDDSRGAPGVDVRDDLLVDEGADGRAERVVVVVVQGAPHAGLLAPGDPDAGVVTAGSGRVGPAL